MDPGDATYEGKRVYNSGGKLLYTDCQGPCPKDTITPPICCTVIIGEE